MITTLFKEKCVKMPILLIFLGIVGLLYPFFILASTIFEDNFENYEYGTLSGQYSWYGGNADVVSDETKTGTHAVYFGTYVSPVGKIGNEINEGLQTVWLFLDTTPAVDGTIDWENSVSWQFYLKWDDCSADDCKFYYYNSELETPAWIEFATIDTGIWHSIQVKWYIVGSQFLWSFNLDFNGWLDELETQTQAVKTVDRIHIGAQDYGNYWIDNISEFLPCELGTCSACSDYNTCMEAGCSWEWFIYEESGLFGYGCAEPITMGEEICGDFIKCQYCDSEVSCNAGIGCEWKNYGYGNKCYMLVPIVPPEQAGWEAPELEDCGALSGVEKWLCEIKNFIAGIFMPSKEKLDILQQTLNNFKFKFPFNYLNALQGFFSDIKTSLSEEKAIPIKILGNEATVDMSFWDFTTIIGGESETFKNVLKDFTSIIILFCWFVWLISFIKRFFP